MGDEQLIQQWELEVKDIGDGFTCHPSQQRWSSDERWERLEKLGRGGYGEVWLQKCTTGPRVGELRAVKEIPKDFGQPSQDRHAKVYHHELSALIKFSHHEYRDFFVSSLGWFQTPKTLFIAMQYFPHGDLQSHISQALPIDETCTITRQILQGISFMHQNKVAHRDLKPANILVQEKGPNWWVKLSDFGCSKEATTLRTTVGTPPYWAPELCHIFTHADEESCDCVEDRTYSFEVDIWAVGVIAYRSATGVLPFGDNLRSKLYRYVRRSDAFPGSPLLTDDSQSFMEWLMSRSPSDRPTAIQALAHPWIIPSSPSSPSTSRAEARRPPEPTTSVVSNTIEASGRWTTNRLSSCNLQQDGSNVDEATSRAGVASLPDGEGGQTKRPSDESPLYVSTKDQPSETSYSGLSLSKLFRHPLSFIARRRSDTTPNNSPVVGDSSGTALLKHDGQATDGEFSGFTSLHGTIPPCEARPIITARAETKISLAMIDEQKCVPASEVVASPSVTSLAFSPDGKWFACGHLDIYLEGHQPELIIWSIDNLGHFRKSHSLTLTTDPLKISFSSDSQRLVLFLPRMSLSWKRERLLAVSCTLGEQGHFEPVMSHYISNNRCVKRDEMVNDGRRIVLVWSDPKSKMRRMTIWDANERGSFGIFQEHEEPNDEFVWSQDGENYLSFKKRRANKPNSPHVFKSKTPGGMLLGHPLLIAGWFGSVAAFSPDGRWCAIDTVFGVDGLLVHEIMQGGRWKLHASLGSGNRASAITFSPDSQTLVVSWCNPDKLTIWRLDGSDKFNVISEEKRKGANCLAFSSSGRLLAIGDGSGMSGMIQMK